MLCNFTLAWRYLKVEKFGSRIKDLMASNRNLNKFILKAFRKHSWKILFYSCSEHFSENSKIMLLSEMTSGKLWDFDAPPCSDIYTVLSKRRKVYSSLKNHETFHYEFKLGTVRKLRNSKDRSEFFYERMGKLYKFRYDRREG